MNTSIQNALDRLHALQGSDEGMYTLAVHSFVEAVIRSELQVSSDTDTDATFVSLVKEYRQYRIDSANGQFVNHLDVLQNLMDSHKPTNYVRHQFANLPRDAALAATQHLLQFCRLSEISEHERLARLQGYLTCWDEQRPYHELIRDNQRLQIENKELSKNQKQFTEELARLRELNREREHVSIELQRLSLELEDEKRRNGERSDRIDQLRKDQATLREEIKGKTKEIESLKKYEDKAEQLRERLVLARTRRDYERMVLRLSTEQTAVLSQIGMDSDFLIKGSAGTGKTLVLLKAIEKAKGHGTGKANAQNEFKMDELNGTVALLTYTNTLVKYDQWLSGLMLTGILGQDDRICTADSFLLAALRKTCADGSIEYSPQFLEDIAAKHVEGTGFTSRELAGEAEEFLWAGHITETEFVTEGIARTGRKTALTREKRTPVWHAISAMKKEMAEQRKFSRCAASCFILESNPEPVVDYLFIDEVQDLPAVVLRTFRALTKKSMILTGDSDQSIYQAGFSFKRAGIDISGHTRILNSNYRNTGPIHELAEKYRKASGGELDNKAIAWRDGTEPVHLTAPNSKSMLDLLSDRIVLFIETFGYEPQNLCILAANKTDVESIQNKLVERGLNSKNIKDPDFDFTSTGAIRVSTMHSAKGLDFPVVFLYLNQHPYYGGTISEEEAEKRTRNLVYVSLTRAMEHLEVFTKETMSDKAVRDLVEMMR